MEMRKETPQNIDQLVKDANRKTSWKARLAAINELRQYDCQQSRDVMTRLALHDKVYEVKEEAFRAAQSFEVMIKGQPIHLGKKDIGYTSKDFEKKFLRIKREKKMDDLDLQVFKDTLLTIDPEMYDVNRDFFDAWQGHKEKTDELDDTKHSDEGGYNFTDNELPIHLAKELDVIAAMIDKAATELALRHCKHFLIVSDHGASRLAVLRRKEERYETDTKGEHSGRCCKLFQPYDLPFAAEENGYLVLADYGRFKGSRAANVEVHGGASLEEVVVPIIELSLKDGSVTVKLVDDTVTVDFRTGTEIKLFFNSPVQDVSVVLSGKPYSASQIDANHYSVKLPDTKRAGEYPADVYASDNLIGKIIIKAQGKSGKINDAFDDLF